MVMTNFKAYTHVYTCGWQMTKVFSRVSSIHTLFSGLIREEKEVLLKVRNCIEIACQLNYICHIMTKVGWVPSIKIDKNQPLPVSSYCSMSKIMQNLFCWLPLFVLWPLLQYFIYFLVGSTSYQTKPPLYGIYSYYLKW